MTPAPTTLDEAIRALVGEALREQLPVALREVLPGLLREALAGQAYDDASPAVESDLLTVGQVATHLNVAEQTVRRWITNGELNAARVGPRKLVRVRRSDLEMFLKTVRQKVDRASRDVDAQAAKIVARTRGRTK